MNELITVILPIYKVEKYLRACVDSVLAQTYSNLEVILVDDGSPDGCPAIVDDYAAKDSRVIPIHQTNAGLSEARNAGLRIAKGQWIVMVDSDDVIDTTMIEKLYKAAVSNDCKMSWCLIKEIEEDAMLDGKAMDNQSENKEDSKIDVISNSEAESYLYTMGGNQQCLVAWNKLYHKDCFMEDGQPIYYPIGKIFEDGYTSYRCIYAAGKIAVLNDYLYYYRQRAGSIMKVNAYVKYEPALEAGDLRMDFYKKHNEQSLYISELNMQMRSIINFYSKIKEKESRSDLKKRFKECYNNRFIKEHWPLGKRVRMKSFIIGYPCYKLISKFEGLYNKAKK